MSGASHNNIILIWYLCGLLLTRMGIFALDLATISLPDTVYTNHLGFNSPKNPSFVFDAPAIGFVKPSLRGSAETKTIIGVPSAQTIPTFTKEYPDV